MKSRKLKSTCCWTRNIKLCSIRNFPQVISYFVASVPGVQYIPLYITQLEFYKNLALKQHKCNFDSNVTLCVNVLSDLSCWIDNIQQSSKLLVHPEPVYVIQSDASGKGWGGVLFDASMIQISYTRGRLCLINYQITFF